MKKIGRPSSCICGTCVRLRGDKIRAADRARQPNHWSRLERLPCDICGVEPADAHHPDYDKPLEVQWLCRKHHGEVHRKYGLDESA